MSDRTARAARALGNALFIAALAVAACSESPGAGRVLTLELTRKLDDGSAVDPTPAAEPIVVRLGDGALPLALEEQLAELEVGSEREIVLEPADAYGEVDPELIRPVPLERIPEEFREVGKIVIGEAPDGKQTPVRVHELTPTEAILDLNHLLAGQRVHFSVKVLKAD